jgi:hypothetical protein
MRAYFREFFIPMIVTALIVTVLVVAL